MLEALYILILTVVWTAFWALTLFKREMKNKSKYKDFLNDAIDGIENNFSGNLNYAHTSCSGIAFYRNEDGSITAKSQSKLHGVSINH